uniref:Uncharacterized protein n=1 Tax=Anguilla anguilla TaxID=7936 RepID=A0A0E9QY23_ANGAN
MNSASVKRGLSLLGSNRISFAPYTAPPAQSSPGKRTFYNP